MLEDAQLPEDIFTTTDKVSPAKEPQAVPMNVPQASLTAVTASPKSEDTKEPFIKKPVPQNLDEAIAEADKEVRENISSDDISESTPDIFMPTSKPLGSEAAASGGAKRIEEPEKKERSSLKVVIFLIIGFIIIAGCVATGYFYFGGNFSSLLGTIGIGEDEVPLSVNDVPKDAMKKEGEQEPKGEVMEQKPIDIRAWLIYTNEGLGITLKYPGTLAVTSDALPQNPKEGTTNTTLILESSDKSERLVLWAHPEGLAAFTIPTGGELNPLSAGTQLILKGEGGGLVVSRTSYQSFSGVVAPNASYLVAYTSDVTGGVRYVMLYTGPGNATMREETLKAIVASISLKLDTDGDGLLNDEEKTYGTDPVKADTDGDSFSDGEEIQNGYNPLGEGKLQ